jgi:hypothetical protein
LSPAQISKTQPQFPQVNFFPTQSSSSRGQRSPCLMIFGIARPRFFRGRSTPPIIPLLSRSGDRSAIRDDADEGTGPTANLGIKLSSFKPRSGATPRRILPAYLQSCTICLSSQHRICARHINSLQRLRG